MYDMIVSRTLLVRRAATLFQTLLLFGLMALLLASVGYLIAGAVGALWSLVLCGIILYITPKISPRLVLRMYNARPLDIGDAPGLYEIVHELSRRAGLSPSPALYYIPSRIMNAFSVGDRRASAIAVTDGLLRNLSVGELAGVLAHEVSHVSSGDLRIMNLADALSRFTNAVSTVGIAALIFYLPLYFLAGVLVPLPAILLLLFAPTAGVLLQMALSRTREFEADLGAVALTGDPRGLASALLKLESYRLRIWDVIFMPGRKVPAPSILRTHPVTEKRIARLIGLAEKKEDRLCVDSGGRILPENCRRVTRDPRWKFGGFWH